MDFNSTVDLIIKDLDEAREIIDDFKNYPDVPLLQIELAKSKCKSASEVISLLKKIQVYSKTAGKKETGQVKQVDLPDPVEVINKPVESHPINVNTVTKTQPTPPSQEKTKKSAIVADTFIVQSDSINEQLGSLLDENDLNYSIKLKPLVNLSDAIGVNDKFLFIKEIFNGSPETYNQAIKKLDESGSLVDAKAIILNYTGENTESDAANQLLDLVKRKFTGNE